MLKENVGQVANLSYAQYRSSQEMEFLDGLLASFKGRAGMNPSAKARMSLRD